MNPWFPVGVNVVVPPRFTVQPDKPGVSSEVITGLAVKVYLRALPFVTRDKSTRENRAGRF